MYQTDLGFGIFGNWFVYDEDNSTVWVLKIEVNRLGWLKSGEVILWDKTGSGAHCR